MRLGWTVCVVQWRVMAMGFWQGSQREVEEKYYWFSF